MKKALSLAFRISFVALVPISALFALTIIRKYEIPVPCLTYKLLGLYCPGCGSGRATRALLNFDLLSALDYNALYVILLPFLSYYLFKVYMRVVLKKDIIPFFRISPRIASITSGIIILFGVIRNIPFFPFNILAP